MRKLILVKHSLPHIVPDLPASQWRLGAAGRQRCGLLAERLAAYDPALVVCSAEPKARETAQIVAGRLGRQLEVVEGLHEHTRDNEAFLSSEQFEARVAALFERPEELVMGRETARQARERFAMALGGDVERWPTGNLVIVAHGTVITLFVAAIAGIEPFPLWKRLGLPSFVVLSLPKLTLLELVEDMSQHQDERPLACDLTAMDAAQRERHQVLTRRVLASVQETRDLPDGYALRLPVDLCLAAAEFITLERLCCPFLTFTLEVERDGGPLWLRLTGREGVKQLLQAELGI